MAEKVAVVDAVGQNRLPVTVTGTVTELNPIWGRVVPLPAVQVPAIVVAALGATVMVQAARPVVVTTTPPWGMLSVAVEPAESYCSATPQLPLVLLVAVLAENRIELVVQLVNVGAVRVELTAPSALTLLGEAGTAPVVDETLQYTL